MALIEKLEAIGEAIRGKTGGREKLTLEDMAEAIASIQTGGGGGASVSEVTLATAFTKASDAAFIFEAMTNFSYTLFIYTGQSTDENQVYSAVIDKTATIVGYHLISYNRYKSGIPAYTGGVGTAYDLKGVVGDTFLMIGGDAP